MFEVALSTSTANYLRKEQKSIINQRKTVKMLGNGWNRTTKKLVRVNKPIFLANLRVSFCKKQKTKSTMKEIKSAEMS